MGMLGVFNGFLYASLYWKIDEQPITTNPTTNGQLITNLLGLAFLLTSD
jgi:hypothetical protein